MSLIRGSTAKSRIDTHRGAEAALVGNSLLEVSKAHKK